MSHRYVLMDGLRGIAAIAVGILHCATIFQYNFPNHAYLAVDFFFCLSGFVIMKAYERKLETNMSVAQFMRSRLIRLYPMIFIGIILGAFVLIGAGIIHHDPIITDLPVLTAGAVLLLPFGLFIGQQAFALNNPLWSLSFELVANFVYALKPRLFHINIANALLLGATGIALASFIWVNGTIDPIGFQDWSRYFEGFARVSYPFMAGVLIARTRFLASLSLKSFLAAMALTTMLFFPFFQYSWEYDSIMALVAVPLIVASSQIQSIIRWQSVWLFLGEISYPFYVVHTPIIRAIVQVFRMAHGKLPAWLMMPLSLLVAGLIAYAALILFDRPIRRYLSKGSSLQVAARSAG